MSKNELQMIYICKLEENAIQKKEGSKKSNNKPHSNKCIRQRYGKLQKPNISSSIYQHSAILRRIIQKTKLLNKFFTGNRIVPRFRVIRIK